MSNDYSPAVVKTHYLAFKEFLETQDNDAKRQRGAKEKLIKLTNQQFQELSTDVYDELIRRTYNSRDSECLQSQSEFQQKRNEARAKLAALSATRYRDLSQDIYNEIQRRFPNIVAEAESENQANSFNNSMSPANFNAKPSQSPYVAPQERQQTPNQKINFAPLDDVMANLKKELAFKNENEDANAQKEISDAELAELKRNNNFLKSKLDSLTEKYQTEKNRLEKELESIQETLTNRVKINEEQATEYSKLYNNYTQLQNDIKTLRSQSEVNEKVTEELRQENDIQIERINQLTTKNDNLEKENKSLKEEIAKLKDESTKLKEETEKLKEELQKEKEKKPEVVAVPSPAKSDADREVKNESPKKAPEPQVEPEPAAVPPEPEMPKPNARDCINPERVSSYREAVNQLLEASKSENPADVLVAMKSIVITCKNITEESDEYERVNEKTFSIDEQDKLIEIKENLSVALTHLMNVTKNHATRYPEVSPSFIESATSELSDTIVSLVRTLKDHQNRLLNQPPLSRSREGSDARQRPINPNTMNMGEYTPNNEQVYDVQELKHFLEERTDLIVQGIQALLQKIQQPNASNMEFSDAIAHITGIVDNVINASQNTFSSQAGIYLYNSGEPILQDLKMGNIRLKEMGSSINNLNEQEIKTLKSSLASASYEIAVFVRDLLELLG
ncbi:hypothetical protein BCR32DRAFT_283927 [Anaeromyces robustus]|uniref:GIT Spa2 homology (SHD) domain-containing protein n=1 Tax=Anaeromyces robustus TaxID=1754192 RepID=A0A1Y1WT03_9FUNG|nr:hypothetical protein BCR32DRAFT_283927 [Anaeromyces robustus]|eukprot:ORX76671.1 hypothetical protein BCR32DRAFT_283927 [Anaeromyces robustus]